MSTRNKYILLRIGCWYPPLPYTVIYMTLYEIGYLTAPLRIILLSQGNGSENCVCVCVFWRWLSSGMLLCAVWWKLTQTSEVLAASIVRVVTHWLMMEAASISETLVNIYQSIRSNNTEDSRLHNHRREDPVNLRVLNKLNDALCKIFWRSSSNIYDVWHESEIEVPNLWKSIYQKKWKDYIKYIFHLFIKLSFEVGIFHYIVKPMYNEIKTIPVQCSVHTISIYTRLILMTFVNNVFLLYVVRFHRFPTRHN
jgi:hypothetical protein